MRGHLVFEIRIVQRTSRVRLNELRYFLTEGGSLRRGTVDLINDR